MANIKKTNKQKALYSKRELLIVLEIVPYGLPLFHACKTLLNLPLALCTNLLGMCVVKCEPINP